jgi:methanethiol S-methyltransferase
MPQEIFNLKGTWAEPVMYTLYGFGWFVGLFSTFLIDHFDLFGLKQAWYNWKGRNDFHYRFKTPLFYKLVRHPIYTGWLMIHWFTPVLTLGHILFATVITVYIYAAIIYEEQDLIDQFGETYMQYIQNTPKLIPFTGKNKHGDVR